MLIYDLAPFQRLRGSGWRHLNRYPVAVFRDLAVRHQTLVASRMAVFTDLRWPYV